MKLRKALTNVLLVPVAIIAGASLVAANALAVVAIDPPPRPQQKIILVSDTVVSHPAIPARPKSADICEWDTTKWCSRVGWIKDPTEKKRALAVGIYKRGHTSFYVPSGKVLTFGKTFQLKQAGTARCAYVSHYGGQLILVMKACTNAASDLWHTINEGLDDNNDVVYQIQSRYVEKTPQGKVHLCLWTDLPDWPVLLLPVSCESAKNWAPDQSFWFN